MEQKLFRKKFKVQRKPWALVNSETQVYLFICITLYINIRLTIFDYKELSYRKRNCWSHQNWSPTAWGFDKCLLFSVDESHVAIFVVKEFVVHLWDGVVFSS